MIPSFDSLGALMMLVFLITLPAAWVAGGSPRVSYAGFQIAFAFYLCVIQGTASATDLTVARDRVIGILFGIAVVYVVFTQIWPVSLAAKVERSLRDLVRDLARIADMPTKARLAASSGFDTKLVETRTDLAVMAYEPGNLRPAADWVKRRGEALDHLAAIEHRLLIAGPQATDGRSELAARLARIAMAEARNHFSAPTPGSQDHLEQLEACLD